MINSIEALLKLNRRTSAFPVTSRYYASEVTTFQKQDGTLVPYIHRRFVPPPERFTTLTEHTVVQCERLDNITAKYLGDPEQFWRVCDANGVMSPEELESAGRKVNITLPEGIAGGTRA